MNQTHTDPRDAIAARAWEVAFAISATILLLVLSAALPVLGYLYALPT